ncbi:MAG TPA: arsenite methyltransferase [Thermoflexales bacterium]|nr:arsenite methyltransferase [Thermoflexales bacterium]HQW35578.1 arsenite methyltransferase [Thermoflexales bacterium]HQX75665.1 arsenite methyltransferase [Thermoflexales bacterium]HQZ21564.1 arsenite methyltransferase [Thermoflexales bacterium]HQZ98954.1 arsenite methyltransferase [Thermoflexales bacterium]
MNNQIIQPDQIREAVRDSYALRATQFLNNTIPAQSAAGKCCSGDESSCCGTNYKAEQLGYNAEEMANLPAEIAEVTLGCGDPTSIANLQPGMTVVDLGSGGGFDCLLAAKKVGETGHVIGVDMTPEMLSLAWKNAAQAGARNVEFRYGHIEKLPVESDTVDVILSNCVINLSPDKPAVFREAYRVLKPGSKFAVSDIVADREITPEAQKNMSSYCSCVSGASEENWYLDQLRAAGFTRVNVVSRVPYADVPNSAAKTWSVKVEAWK